MITPTGSHFLFDADYGAVRLREDAFTVLVSYFCPFVSGLLFFSKWLFRDYAVKSVMVQVMFGATFSFSVHMQELVLFEIMGVMKPETRWLCWKLDLYFLILILTIISPVCFFWSLVRQGKRLPFRAQIISVVAMYSIFLYFYTSLGSHVPHSSSQSSEKESREMEMMIDNIRNNRDIVGTLLFAVRNLLSIEYSVGRIGILGVAAMATLSGFGAVANVYKHLSVFLMPYSDKEIHSLEQRTLQTLNQIASKKKRLLLLIYQKNQSLSSRGKGPDIGSSKRSSGSNGSGGSSGSRVSSSGVFSADFFEELASGKSPGVRFTIKTIGFIVYLSKLVASGFISVVCGLTFGSGQSDIEVQVKSLKQEISSLEAFHRELFLDLSELHLDRERLLFSKTLRGYLHFTWGYGFSVYCVYKLGMSTINVLLSRDPKKDPITRAFEIFFMFFDVKVDVQFWSQFCSLIMVGILVVGSVRGFLITISKIFHQISTSISSNSVILLLLQIMGMYFISFTLLMRMNLPVEYRKVVTDVLGGGDMQFGFYHRFSDRIFLVSAIGTLITLYVLHSQKKARTKLHSLEDKLA